MQIAIQICEKLGYKLKVAGQLGHEYKDFKWPQHVEFVGHVNMEERNELMKNAIATIVPSRYLEPFG